MLGCDIWGTRAHVLMLEDAGIIGRRAAGAICRALDEVERAAGEGTFRIDPERGAQLSLEQAVISAVGVEDASRMHTARSRNDQVMVTEMLHLRERALALAGETCGAIEALLDRALTAELFSFSRVWEGPQDAISFRGLLQLDYVDVCKLLEFATVKIYAE